MKFIIDRFEGNYAVVELEKKMINVPKEIVPKGAVEGSVISVVVDEDETIKMKQKIKNSMNKLWE